MPGPTRLSQPCFCHRERVLAAACRSTPRALVASSIVTRSLAACSTADSRARPEEVKRPVTEATGISYMQFIAFQETLYIHNIPINWFLSSRRALGIFEMLLFSFTRNFNVREIPIAGCQPILFAVEYNLIPYDAIISLHTISF